MVTKKRKTRKYTGRTPLNMDIFGRSKRFIFYIKPSPQGTPLYILKLVLKPGLAAPKANYWLGYRADDKGTYVTNNRDLLRLLEQPKALDMIKQVEEMLLQYLEINPPKPWAIERAVKHFKLKQALEAEAVDPFEGS